MTLIVAGVWTVIFPSLRNVDRFTDLEGASPSTASVAPGAAQTVPGG
jgi:hypothetical protein